MRCWVNQQVLRLDISVANTHGVDVSKGSESLVSIKLHQKIWNRLLHLVVMLEHTVYSFRDVVHNDV